MRDKDSTTVAEADQSAVALAKADPASRIQSSHPDIESHANPMKTITITFFNRHTHHILHTSCLVEGWCFSSAVTTIETIPYHLRRLIRAKFCVSLPWLEMPGRQSAPTQRYTAEERTPARCRRYGGKSCRDWSSSRRYKSKIEIETKSKREEKALARRGLFVEAALARRSCGTKAANRYTWKIEIR